MSGQTLKNTWFARHKILTGLVSIFLLVAFIFLFRTLKGAHESTTSAAETVVEVTASQLYSDYKRDDLAADQKYKNKTLEISGKIATIETVLGQVFVNLETEDPTGNVGCALADSENEKAEALAVGEAITLTGNGDGMPMNVEVSNCKIQ